MEHIVDVEVIGECEERVVRSKDPTTQRSAQCLFLQRA